MEKNNVNDCLELLSEEEVNFIKGTVKYGLGYGTFNRIAQQKDGYYKTTWFYAYIPTPDYSQDAFKFLNSIWRKLIRKSFIINYTHTPLQGDVLLINEKYTESFEKWAERV